jgi:hypothetical protein
MGKVADDALSACYRSTGVNGGSPATTACTFARPTATNLVLGFSLLRGCRG